jgi:hypothetical protein
MRGRERKSQTREEEKLQFFFFVKLPKQHRFGRLNVYNRVTRKKGLKRFFFFAQFF